MCSDGEILTLGCWWPIPLAVQVEERTDAAWDDTGRSCESEAGVLGRTTSLGTSSRALAGDLESVTPPDHLLQLEPQQQTGHFDSPSDRTDFS